VAGAPSTRFSRPACEMPLTASADRAAGPRGDHRTVARSGATNRVLKAVSIIATISGRIARAAAVSVRRTPSGGDSEARQSGGPFD
jgi:hypothetical protein